jgi:ribosomal protein L29
MDFLPLADVDLIPLAGILVGFGLLVILPVVAILTEHQRKMARILHGQTVPEESSTVVMGMAAGKLNDKTENAVLDELRSMRSELADLRMQVATLQGSDHSNPDSVRTRLTQSP